MEPEYIIAPIILIALVVLIVILFKFRSAIKMKSRYSSFYNVMERMNDRYEKKKYLEYFLLDCYSTGNDNKRTCPVCGKRFSVTEKVTDQYGDVSLKTVEKNCPGCNTLFTFDYTFKIYGIKPGVEMPAKYEKKFALLNKYFEAYKPVEPNYGGNGGGGVHGTFIPD